MNASTTSRVKYLKHCGNSISLQYSITQECVYVILMTANLLFLLAALTGWYLNENVRVVFSCEVGTKYLPLFRSSSAFRETVKKGKNFPVFN